jgi:hypothetical protein
MHVQSVPITTKFVSSNPAHGGMHSIQLYVMKFVSDFWHVDGFIHVLRFPPLIKTDRHDISEILLKVVLSKRQKHLVRPKFSENVISLHATCRHNYSVRL